MAPLQRFALLSGTREHVKSWTFDLFNTGILKCFIGSAPLFCQASSEHSKPGRVLKTLHSAAKCPEKSMSP